MRFGSVGGGGRYDGLVSRFRGEPVPATGFSIGVSRLMTALKNLGKLDTSDVLAPVVVLVMDRDTESLGRYQKMVSALRQAGIRAEMYLGGAGMKAQMKYADRRGAPCVVIQGGDERAKGEVQIKDLIEGARLSAEITDNADWREAPPGAGDGAGGRAGRRGAEDPGGAGGRAQPWEVKVAFHRAPLSCRTSPPQGGDWRLRLSQALTSDEASVGGSCSTISPRAGRCPAGPRRGDVGDSPARGEAMPHDLPLSRHRARHPRTSSPRAAPRPSTCRSSSRPIRSSTWPARICAAASS